MSYNIEGLRILVTGATSGIGLTTAEVLHQLGAQLILMGRNADALASLAERLGAETHALDITDETAVAEAIAGMGALDGLVNCAGISILDSVLEFKPADIDKIMAVNVTAAAHVAKLVAQNMVDHGRAGSIVNVSSQAGLVALRNHLGYCASKSALDSMTRVLCLELGEYGIRVNSVNPTVTLTPMAEMAWADPAKRGPMLAAIPLRRFAQPQEVAYPIAFLLSPAASMISGTALPIDGGFVAQ
ncbi:SDR family oxidoreductase [Saccharospirillum mangrovi]|uniref:SDR family oxidoreductase n=1 Tax=Saccharospirillum mangrovi TaxID=2161747 RepID=UPI000D336B6C|nr:SDR family oxidoreductase [Saccharospirillum mangrovi]